MNSFFGIATMIISIPTGAKLFNWLFTMYRGRIRYDAPMMWTVAFMLTFTIGGMTGVLLAVPPADFVLHNSLFLVAHFHNVIIGGVLFGLFAGIIYWWPKAFGFRLDPFWGNVSFWCWITGFWVAFMPLYILGLMGVTRRVRVFDDPSLQILVPDRRTRRRADRLRHRRLPDPDRRLDLAAATQLRDTDRRSLGRPHAGMGDLLAAAVLQLRLHAGRARGGRLVGHEDPWLRSGRWRASGRSTCRRTPPRGMLIAGCATVFGMALIWYIWWLAALAFLGAIASRDRAHLQLQPRLRHPGRRGRGGRGRAHPAARRKGLIR